MKKEMNQKPLGIKLISILAFILFIISIILAFGFIFSKSVPSAGIASFFEEQSDQQMFNTITTIVLNSLFILGFVLIPISLLFLAVGLGLLKGKEWARMMTVAISVLFLIVGILETMVFGFTGIFFENIITILLSGTIIWYLLFFKKIHDYFL